VKAVSEISSAETVSDCQFDPPPLHSSLRKYQHGAHYKNLRKIRYWEILPKYVDKFQIWLKSGTSHEDLSAVFLLPATLNRLRKYQHGAHYKNLRKIRYWEILPKSVDKFQIWLKSGISHEDLSAVFLLPASLNRHKSAFSEGNGIRLLE